MTLNQLRYFQAVAKLENFRAAAEGLYISQPSLSRAIDSLEQELGVVLFERVGRGIALTGNGRIFLEHVNRILDECDRAVSKMKEISTTGGRIEIGYVFPLANSYIPHNVRSFLNLPENERVTFGFVQSFTSDIIRDLKNGRLDVGFCASSENEEKLEFTPVLEQEMVIITPLRHPLADKEELSITELTHYPVIGYDSRTALGDYTVRLYRSLGIDPHIVCECPDENAIQALVREEFGIALVARADILNEQYLRIHRISDIRLAHNINIAWAKNHYMKPAAKRFIEFMISGSNSSAEAVKSIT